MSAWIAIIISIVMLAAYVLDMGDAAAEKRNRRKK